MQNKKVLIIESCEKKLISDDSPKTSIVHIRNSIIIKNILNCDMITHLSQIDSVINNKYDIIICMYASPYMKYNEYMRIMDANHTAKMYWLVNDHDLEDNILLRKWLQKYDMSYNMICNNPREGYRHWILGKKMQGKKLNDWIYEWNTLNLNCLIFDNDFSTNVQQMHIDKKDCIYYGTFRKHRIKDMLRYDFSNYVLSISKKNQIKYDAAGIKPKEFVDRLSWEKDDISLLNYKYSIYFEDEHTHKNYAFIANRYYECLMCDVLMFFDSKCDLVISKCGYNIDPYLIVSDSNELNTKMVELNSNNELYLQLLNKQRSNIAIINTERKQVEQQINSIIYN